MAFDVRRSVAMAIVLALAVLTKLSALVLVPVIAVAALYVARRTKDNRGLLVLGGISLVIGLLITGWWFARNLNLYSELFGTATMAAVAGERVDPFGLGTLFSEFQGFRISYWGVFGAFNVQTSELFYVLMDLMVLLAMGGFIFLVLQLLAIRDFGFARYEVINLGFLFLILFIGTGALIAWTSQTLASQGRLLFPFITAISAILAVGLAEVIWWVLFSLRPPNLQFVRAGDAVPDGLLKEGILWPLRILGVLAFVIPFITIAPQYAPPAPLDELPNDVVDLGNIRFGDVELIGYKHRDVRHSPGDSVDVTLYWKVVEQSEENNSVSLTLLSPDQQEVGKIDSYPGAGRLTTTSWEPGKIYPDRYLVQLRRGDASSAGLRYPLRLQVGWWNFETEEYIDPVVDEQSLDAVLLNAGAVVSGNVSLSPNGFINIEEKPLFGDVILLNRFNYDDEISQLILEWETRNTPDDDYTVFVHVFDEEGNLIAQGDAPPSDLPTHYWRFGEVYRTYHTIEAPDGIEIEIDPDLHTFKVGWYLNDEVEGFPRLVYTQPSPITVVPAPDFEATEEPEDELIAQDAYTLIFLEPEDPEATAEATSESTAEMTAESTDSAEEARATDPAAEESTELDVDDGATEPPAEDTTEPDEATEEAES